MRTSDNSNCDDNNYNDIYLLLQDSLKSDIRIDGLEMDLERTIELLKMYDLMKRQTEKGALVLLKAKRGMHIRTYS